MRKIDELKRADSCLAKARNDEILFVLLARDEAAPDTIRHWASIRVAGGKNKADDPQILEALACADAMERER